MIARAGNRGLRLVLALLVVVMSGCGGTPAAGEVTADAYVAALREFMPEPPGPDDEPPTVFVVPIGETALDLDTQVSVIDAFTEQFDVRFVDDPQAAIAASPDDDPDRMIHVVGIGTIHATAPHTVRVEQYTDATTTDAHRVTLVARNTERRVESIAAVEPEVLVGDG